MKIQSASMTIVTSKLPETRHFYETHFDARPLFDCGWYVVLRLGASGSGPEVCLMEPKAVWCHFPVEPSLTYLSTMPTRYMKN